MKFNCGPTQDERRQAARDVFCVWHRWFAWFPVRIAHGDCRWLEFVERRAQFVVEGHIFEFAPCQCEYRAIREVAA